MSQNPKINAYTTLIALIVGVVAGLITFYIMPLMGADASDRRPIAVFGEDVARTLTPMLDETRTEPLTATDAKAIASLKQTYDALERNKSVWHEDTAPPDAPFFKTLAQYDAEKMSAFKQTTLLASARRDVNQFVDETKAFNHASPGNEIPLRIIMSAIISLIVGALGALIAHQELSEHYTRNEYYARKRDNTSTH